MVLSISSQDIAVFARVSGRWRRGCRAVALLLSVVAATAGSAAALPARPTDATSPAASKQRPNIVVILADDAGWADVGFHGSEIRTPVLDNLAKNGVELTQFYAYAACSPTRAALLTGRPASRFNIITPLQLENKDGLPAGTVTIAELLRRNGYDTAITGKWHLGMSAESGPNRYGFSHAYGYLGPWLDSWTHLTTDFGGGGEGVRQWHRNGELVDERGHVTDLITAEAIRYLREIRDKTKPFLLYVPYSAPHTPVQEERKWLTPYDGVIENTSRKYYAAAMTHLDDGVGRIITELESEGALENTLVIFLSDNGAARGGNYQERWLKPPVEYYQSYGPTDKLGENAPYRGWKNSHYEGGIRVPALVYWKGKLAPGKSEAPMIVYDLYPTLARLAKTETAEKLTLEGKDIWPQVAENAPAGERIFYWRLGGDMAVRKGDWKLIQSADAAGRGSDELYNLSEDPYEKSDRATMDPGKLEELKRELTRQRAADDEKAK